MFKLAWSYKTVTILWSVAIFAVLMSLITRLHRHYASTKNGLRFHFKKAHRFKLGEIIDLGLGPMQVYRVPDDHTVWAVPFPIIIRCWHNFENYLFSTKGLTIVWIVGYAYLWYLILSKSKLAAVVEYWYFTISTLALIVGLFYVRKRK